MQIGKDTALRLLIVDDSVEAAEAVVSALRNAGIAVRPFRPENVDELVQRCCQPAARPGAWPRRPRRSLATRPCSQQVDASGKDLPVLPSPTRIDEAAVHRGLALGARAVALRDRNDHLLTVVADRVGRPRGAPRTAPARGPGARDRTPLRRADRVVARSDRLRARRHAHPRQRGVPGDVRLRIVRRRRGHCRCSTWSRPRTSSRFKQLLKKLSKGEAPPPRFELEARDARRQQLPGRHGIHRRPSTRANTACRWCSAAAGARPGTGPRGRGAAPARPDHRPAQPPHLPACAGGRGGRRARRTPRHHGSAADRARPLPALLQDIGLDAADDLCRGAGRTACSETRGRRHARRRALRRAQFAVLLGGDHAHTAELAERVRDRLRRARVRRRRAFAQRSPSASAACRSARRSPASPRCSPAPARACSPRRHGRQPHRDLRPRRGRSRRGRAHAGWVDAHPRRARVRPLRHGLPAGGQPAGRAGRDLRGLPAPARTTASSWRRIVPADRRGTTACSARSTAGSSAARIELIGERRRAGHAPRCWSRSPGFAADDSLLQVHRGAAGRARRARRAAVAAAARSQGVHPPARSAGVPGRRGAPGLRWGWSSSAPA